MSKEAEKKIERVIEQQSKKFYKQLIKNELPTPSLFDLMIFRLSRSGIKAQLGEDYKDYVFYKDMGWFESDFFYPVKLNPVKKLSGKLFDAIA